MEAEVEAEGEAERCELRDASVEGEAKAGARVRAGAKSGRAR